MNPVHEDRGLIVDPTFISMDERSQLMAWLETIAPLWENRHAADRRLRAGQKSRRLLRPVYWLGGWQFACLNYFHPPTFAQDRVVAAEPFPSALATLVSRIEERARATYAADDLPQAWCLNTCLINFYGLTERDGRFIDTARVYGHRDHEPGPVASLSLGAKARFQFATRARGPVDEDVVKEIWLQDRALLVFATPRWKSDVLHRVPEVAREDHYRFAIPVSGFRIRRVNFTLRYVPQAFILPFHELAQQARTDVRGYVETLSETSRFFSQALKLADEQPLLAKKNELVKENELAKKNERAKEKG